MNRTPFAQEYTISLRVVGTPGSAEIAVHYFTEQPIADALVAERAKGLVMFGLVIDVVIEVEVYHKQRDMKIFGILTDAEHLNPFGSNQAKSGFSYFYKNIEID